MATKALNEMLTSPMAPIAAAVLDMGIDAYEHQAQERGKSRVEAGVVDMLRRFSTALAEAGQP